MKYLLVILSASLLSMVYAGEYSTHAPTRLDYDHRSAHAAPVVNPTASGGGGVFVSMQQRFIKGKRNETRWSGYGFRNGVAKTRIESKASPTTVAVGYVFARDCWYAGASLSLETGSRKYEVDTWRNGSYNKFRDQTYGITLFGRLNMTDGYYAKGSGFIGYRHSKTKYSYYEIFQVGRDNYTKGDADKSASVGMSVEFGKSLLLGASWGLTPHLGLDYSFNPSSEYDRGFQRGTMRWQDKWSERHYLEIPVGVRLTKTAYCGPWTLTGDLDVTFVGSIGNRNVWYTGFSSRTTDEWKVYGIGGGSYGGRVKGGLTARYSDRISLGVDYAFEGRKKYTDHRISATFGLAF